MLLDKRFFSSLILSVLGAISITSIAQASIIGVTVDGLNSNTVVGDTADRSLLPYFDEVGDNAVEYFIPLSSGSSCTYGVGCGTSSDYGSGGTLMSMFILFDGVSTTSASILDVYFEDLDLIGANDPYGFFEKLTLYDGSGGSHVIDDINDSGVSGSFDTQQLLSFDLGTLNTDKLWIEMVFSASYTYINGSPKKGWNTAEYLVAEVRAVPEPAVLALMGVGLVGLGLVRRRKQNA